MNIFFGKKKLNKKGSHVGIILSFSIFITSLIFILSVFGNQIDSPTTKKDKLEFLESSFLQKISGQLIEVRVNDGNASGCSEFPTPSVSWPDFDVLSIGPTGEEFASDIYSGRVVFDGGVGFSKFYFFEEGLNKTMSKGDSACNSVEVKSEERKDIVLESKIKEVIRLIENDYQGAKGNLSVGIDDDFNILFYTQEGEIIGEEEIELQTEVYAKEVSLAYLAESGRTKIGKAVIKIW